MRGGALFWGLLLGGAALALLALERKTPPVPRRSADDEEAPPVGAKDDIETLGRALASEIASGTREQKLAVAWVLRNLARQKGRSIWELLCSPCGPQNARRPASTRLPAREGDLVIATEVLSSPESDDPTAGATHFLDPRSKNYQAIRLRWGRKFHWKPYRRIGEELELWGP